MRIDSPGVTNITTESFLDRLRRETSPAHKSLEALPLSLAIVSTELKTDEYKLYLRLMYPVIAEAEQDIFPRLQHIIPYFPARTKAQLLKKDLEFLGCDPTTIKASPFAEAGYTFTPASAMGIMYVIEGSTLGGRVILKNVERTLGLTGTGSDYFAGYGSETGPLWKSFLGCLTDFAKESIQPEEIVSGATFAFTTIYHHLEKNL